MAAIKGMSVSKKLTVGFLVIAMVTALTGINSIIKIEEVSNNGNSIYEEITIPIQSVSEISVLIQKQRVDVRQLLLESNQSQRRNIYREIIDRDNRIVEMMTRYSDRIFNNELEEKYKIVSEDYNVMKPHLERVITLGLAMNDKEAWLLLADDGKLSLSLIDLEESFESLIQSEILHAQQEVEAINQINSQSRWMQIRYTNTILRCHK